MRTVVVYLAFILVRAILAGSHLTARLTSVYTVNSPVRDITRLDIMVSSAVRRPLCLSAFSAMQEAIRVVGGTREYYYHLACIRNTILSSFPDDRRCEHMQAYVDRGLVNRKNAVRFS